ncbi:MAG: hypothetical protein ACR2JU_14140 [Nocardioidaceae bacterium]
MTHDSASVAYRTEEGGLAEKIVFASMLPHLKAVEPGSAFTFDAEPDALLLAAEARRMRLAHLFDPLAALRTSDVEPLPHQLRAVYGEIAEDLDRVADLMDANALAARCLRAASPSRGVIPMEARPSSGANAD